MFDWNWDFTCEILPRLLAATVNTLIAAGLGYAIAVVLGLVFALAQRTPWGALTFAVREVVEFIRSTPLVLQIFFVFYVGPQFGIRLSPWTAGMIAIGLHYAAYLSEVYRAGIESVPKGQWEACRRAQPVDARHLPAHRHPAGAAPVARGDGQLPRRHLQGHADAVA